MGLWSLLFGTSKKEESPHGDIPLPILVHCHSREALPPGPLEEGMMELDQDDFILHAVAGIVQPDGTLGELPEDKIEWARRLTYRHLKREGCLAEFGIPIMPGYERDEPGSS